MAALRAAPWFEGAAELTAEEGLAKVLGLSWVRALTFDVAGEPRRIDAGGNPQARMGLNAGEFLLMASPSAMVDRPQSWITAFREPNSAPNVEPNLEPNLEPKLRPEFGWSGRDPM
jgi:predicted lysophospholipase L1 biosynthesis ABC-type transport system permease subunit